jgi:pyrroline-5-carboxylate reductase
MTPASEDRALLIVGGGRMGEALLAGLLEAGRLPSELLVAETSPSRRAELAAAHPGVEVLETPARLASAVLAVKPGDAADAAVAIADAGAERVLSIAAGVTTQAIERAVSGRLRVVRAMPNMPAVIGAAAAAVTGSDGPRGGPGVGRGDSRRRRNGRARGRRRYGRGDRTRGIGSGIRVPGRGSDGRGRRARRPAAGRSRDAAFQTLLGSARLFVHGGATPTGLRAAVTSPGGTTAAGLRELERRGVRAAFLDAVTAATERSRELGA